MTPRLRPVVVLLAGAAVFVTGWQSIGAQAPQAPALDRLAGMPGVDQFLKMQAALQGPPAVVSGALTVSWAGDGKSFTYASAGKQYQFDLATLTAAETGEAPANAGGLGARGGAGRGGGRGGQGVTGAPPPGGTQGVPPAGRGRGGPASAAQQEMPAEPMSGCPATQVARGRQRECVISPDGKLKAFYRARNFWIANVDGTGERQVTTDGDEKKRLKSGTGSWVYGEELSQTTAIWWSPDSTKVATYRFDESKVKDYYIQMDQTQVTGQVDIEAYPKSGADNPVPEVLLHDLLSKRTATIDVRDGKPFTNDVVGHYVYNVGWSPDGTELTMNRTNRRQQIMEFIACSPSTTKCRVIVREEWQTGWVDNRPQMRLLEDKKRFIWESERNGYTNYYLYDFSGKLITPITQNTTFDSGAIVKVDETAGVMFYTARDGDNHMKMQLHRVGLDGRNDVRLTDPKFTHTVSVSPDNKFLVDVYQTHDQPPATQLLDASGKVLAQLAKSDLTKFNALGLKKVEMFTYKAADGQTTLYGTICVSVEFRSVEEVPDARAGLWRSGLRQQRADRELRDAESVHRVRFPCRQRDVARGARHGTQDARHDLHEARPDRDGRHGRGHQGALVASVLRQGPRRYSRLFVRRLYVGDADPETSRRLHRGLGRLAGDVVGPLRLDLHRALHVDPAGERSRLLGGQRDGVRQEPQGPPAHLLRDRRQQRAPEQRDATHPCAAAGRQELRGAGGTRCRAQQRRQPAHDGVLHREPGAAAGTADRAGREVKPGALTTVSCR